MTTFRTRLPPRRRQPGAAWLSSTPAKTTVVVDLANRYRLSERYAREGDPESPSLIGAYRLGVVEVSKDSMLDNPQGAPQTVGDRPGKSIFVERPVDQASEHGRGRGDGSGVSSGSSFAPKTRVGRWVPKPLEGLSVFRQDPGRASRHVLVLSMNDGPEADRVRVRRRSRDRFSRPRWPRLLPVQPVRVGDAWRINRRGLAGDPRRSQRIQGETLIGRFAGTPQGGRRHLDMVAAIAISRSGGRRLRRDRRQRRGAFHL